MGIDIADWWNHSTDEHGRPILSSRRLVLLLRQLPEDSLFKTAFRDGDWTSDQYLKTALINELRIMRADNAAFQGHEMEPVLIKSPREQEVDEIDNEQKQRVRAGILAQLHREN